jgi:predicted ester cyclase
MLLPNGSRRLARKRRSSMSAEENMALVRRFWEARVVKRDLDAVAEMLAPDFVNHNKLVPGQEPDREDYLRGIAAFHAAQSEGQLIIEDQVAGGDKVVTRFVVHGPHDRGELMGVAPTGKVLTNRAIVIHRISDGKIAEEWGMGTIGATLRKQRLEQEIRERERVEQELRVARSIQQAALPREIPTLEGWEISPYYLPAREVGGDFYEFFELDDGRVGFAVGDATGKGVPAAFVMSNEAVLARIPPNMFVTCFYAILDPQSGHLVYANAGHNLPCCAHGGATSDLSARGMPLGLMRGMRYEEEEALLVPGESVLLYSDGLIEAHDPHGEMFGTSRLRNLLSDYPPDAQTLNALLLEELKRFTGGGWEQEDDITLLTLRRSASLS